MFLPPIVLSVILSGLNVHHIILSDAGNHFLSVNISHLILRTTSNCFSQMIFFHSIPLQSFDVHFVTLSRGTLMVNKEVILKGMPRDVLVWENTTTSKVKGPISSFIYGIPFWYHLLKLISHNPFFLYFLKKYFSHFSFSN